jgi:hypothetical protein
LLYTFSNKRKYEKTKINYQLESFLSKEDLLKLKGGEAGTGQWMACSCDGGVNPPFNGT